ncbi:MAG: hypothetical protein AAF456_02490 [Planctomycetota bacterium]
MTLLLATGCTSEDRLATFQVTGLVHVDGSPVEGVVLQLVPDKDDPLFETRLRPGAVSRADGSFQFMTYSTGDGAPSGSYRLIFFLPPDESSPVLGLEERENPGPPDIFDGKYFSASDSEWEVEVGDGPTDIGTVEALTGS